MSDLDSLLVIAPNLKKRLSGVTTTIIQLVPKMQEMGLDIRTLGPGLPDHIPSVSYGDLIKCLKKPRNAPHRIFHARRNLEMLLGLFLKHILRMPLKLLFTSASRRHHTSYTKWLISKMDDVIAVSQKTGAYLEVPHHVILHGIDTNRFKPATDKVALKQTLGLDPTVPLIGCFGRLRPSKGTDLYIEAMIRLLKDNNGENTKWQAIFMGRATPKFKSFEDKLFARLQESGLQDRIHFLGEDPNIEKYYQVLDLYIAPQRYEGFGLTPLEAMACAVPVIATDVGAFAEILPKDAGKLITQTEDEAVIQTITHHAHSYINDPQLLKSHSKKSYEHIQDHFKLENEAAAIVKVYNSLLQDA